MKRIDKQGEESRSKAGWLLRVILVILWAFIIVTGYFWAHKPFTSAVALGLGRTLGNILIWILVNGLGAALGRRLLARRLADENAATRLALYTSVGLGLISLAVLGLGLVGLYRTWAAWLLVALLAALLWRDLVAVAHEARALTWPQPETRQQRWFLIYGATSLVLTFLLTLTPPTAWDSLTYHLTGPQLYAAAGRIVHPVDIPQLGFPLLGQMQFGLGMLLLGDGSAPLFHFGYGLMALAITAALARRAFGKNVAWYAAILLLAVPSFLSLMTWAYVDLTLLFYATAAFYGFLRWREAYLRGNDETGWLLLVGLMSGFAGSVKYTAVLVPFALALSIAWITRRDGLLPLARRLASIATVTVVLIIPYLVENWLTTGNPVYPFFFDNGQFWDAWRAWWYDRPGTGLAATAPWRLPLVPLELSILATDGSNYYDATVGPLLFMALGMLLIVWHALNREVRAIAAHMLLFAGLNYLLWLNGVARTALLLQARLLFLIFGVVAVLGGLALARLPRLSRPQLDVSWIVHTVVNLSLLLLLVTTVIGFLKVNPLPAAVGLEARSSFVARRLGVYEAAMEAVNALPEGAKVDFLWETRSYGCRVECWPDPILDRFLHYTHYYGFDAAELAAYWQREGYSHVLLHEAGLGFVVERAFDPVTTEDLEILEMLQEQYLEPVIRWEGGYTLYEIVPQISWGPPS